jgi:hypothetical protein
MVHRSVILCIVAILVATAGPLVAREPDPADTVDQEQETGGGWWTNILPIPLFITEPAIGYGLGAALTYIHPREDQGLEPTEFATPQSAGRTASGEQRPPDMTAVAAGYTDKDTWLVGGGHSASWREDRIRYAGGLAWANINATYYVRDDPLDFNIEGVLLYQDVKFRIGSSRFFIGGKLLALGTENTFDLDLGEGDPVPIGLGDTNDIGLAIQGNFDRRDNTFTPNRGQLITLDVWRYDESFGGDFNYWKGDLKALSFHQLGSDFVLGLRLELAAASGDPPFWGYPWITLRGIPAMRYQNELVGVGEVELRWNFARRWAVVGFFGEGGTDGDNPVFETANDIRAGGVGARYLFKEDLGLWVGGDFAVGPEDEVVYIQVGHAW